MDLKKIHYEDENCNYLAQVSVMVMTFCVP